MAEKDKTKPTTGSGFHIKFKDKTSQKWFRSRDFDDKQDMLDHYWGKVRAAACDVTFHSPKGNMKEDIEMTTTTDLVYAAIEDEANDVRNMFDEIMTNLVADGIETIRPSVTGAMFGATEPAEVEEKEDLEDKAAKKAKFKDRKAQRTMKNKLREDDGPEDEEFEDDEEWDDDWEELEDEDIEEGKSRARDDESGINVAKDKARKIAAKFKTKQRNESVDKKKDSEELDEALKKCGTYLINSSLTAYLENGDDYFCEPEDKKALDSWLTGKGHIQVGDYYGEGRCEATGKFGTCYKVYELKEIQHKRK